MKNIIKKLSTIFLLLLVTGCSFTTNKILKNEQNTKSAKLSTHKAALVTDDFLSESALHDAVRANDLELVQFLVKQGIEKNRQDQYGYTPLHLAVRLHNFEITKYLIAKGANVNTYDVYDDTPLLDSTRNNDTNISKELICNGANRNVSDRHDMSTLHNSSKNNNKFISTLLRADNIGKLCSEEVVEKEKQVVVQEPISEEPEATEEPEVIEEPIMDEVVSLNIKIDVEPTINDNTPKICGSIVEGDIVKVFVVLEDTDKEMFGIYNATIDNENNTWCADVTDKLANGNYIVTAEGFDDKDNKVNDTAPTKIHVIQGLYDALVEEFKNDFEPWNANLDKDTLKFRFEKPQYLFKRGSDILQPKFQTILEDFFPRYTKILLAYKTEIQNVRIEGHASSEHSLGKTIEEKYKFNKILSDKRANTVLRYTKNLDHRIINDNIDWINNTFKAEGFSSSQLVYNEDGSENKEKSRRVVYNIITQQSDITLD